ncbi:MAG TPA: hypothetical protein VKN99_04130 [Polyangia bacterium]|nr:hypothetical protein [Polyangia bacterium]
MALDRTHRARHDLDWLPRSLQTLRWSVAGTLWTGATGLVVAAIAFAKTGFVLWGWKGLAGLFAGSFYAGDRAARAVLRRRLARLAHGKVDLTRLAREADGELVHVAGRVRARETLPSVLGAEPVVYRRVVFAVDGARWVHEAARDFWIEDGSGELALVEVADAHLVVTDPHLHEVLGEDARRVHDLMLAPELRDRTEVLLRARRREHLSISAGELVLRDGDPVEVVGYKTRTVDPTVFERLAREAPLRATLRSGRELPLLVAPGRPPPPS